MKRSLLLLLLLIAAHAETVPLIASYFSPYYPTNYQETIAALTLQGIVNREAPQLWLNSSSNGFASVPIMWCYPDADVHWREYLETDKGIAFTDLPSGDLCTLLQPFGNAVRGLVFYDYPRASEQRAPTSGEEAAQFLAVTAAGLLDALPVNSDLQDRYAPCLARMDILYTVPNFTDFEAAYAWGIEALLPNTTSSCVCSTCRPLANYTCNWSDPLGTASIDFGVARRAFVFSLSPDAEEYPAQAALFARVVGHLSPLAFLIGWASSETGMVAQLSQAGGTVQCGAPNLSFWSSPALAGTPARLPNNRQAPDVLDPAMYYIIFQSNEGDTPKDAYSLRGGQWLQRSEGRVPIAWGVDPLLATYAPGLWNYYAETASANDSFFAATAGAGYTYPWSLPADVRGLYFELAGNITRDYMPEKFTSVDVWEGGLNKSMYELYRQEGNNAVSSFSQQPYGTAINTWLEDGTPLFLADLRLWYTVDRGVCNASTPATAMLQCMEALVMDVVAANPPPFFILIYGMRDYVTAAAYLRDVLHPERFRVVGAQDMANLGRQAAPPAPTLTEA